MGKLGRGLQRGLLLLCDNRRRQWVLLCADPEVLQRDVLFVPWDVHRRHVGLPDPVLGAVRTGSSVGVQRQLRLLHLERGGERVLLLHDWPVPRQCRRVLPNCVVPERLHEPAGPSGPASPTGDVHLR